MLEYMYQFSPFLAKLHLACKFIWISKYFNSLLVVNGLDIFMESVFEYYSNISL